MSNNDSIPGMMYPTQKGIPSDNHLDSSIQNMNNIQKIIYSVDNGNLKFERVKNLTETHLSRGQRAILRDRNANCGNV